MHSQIHQFRENMIGNHKEANAEIAECMFADLFSDDIDMVFKSMSFIRRNIKLYNSEKFINNNIVISLINVVNTQHHVKIIYCILNVIYLFSKEFPEFFQLIINNNLYELISNNINNESQYFIVIMHFLMNITSFKKGIEFVDEFFGIHFFINLETNENTYALKYKYKVIANMIYFCDSLDNKDIEVLFTNFQMYFQNNLYFTEMFICLYNLFQKSAKWQYMSNEYNLIFGIQKLLSDELIEFDLNTYLFIFKLILLFIKSGIAIDIDIILKYFHIFCKKNAQDNIQLLLNIIHYSIIISPNNIELILDRNEYDIFTQLLQIYSSLNFRIKIKIFYLLYLIIEKINENTFPKIIQNQSFSLLIIQGLQITNHEITIKILKTLRFLILNDNSFFPHYENSIMLYLNEIIVNDESDAYNLSESIINEITMKTGRDIFSSK